jgi:hypothetical protein
MTRREMVRVLNEPNVDTPLGLRNRAHFGGDVFDGAAQHGGAQPQAVRREHEGRGKPTCAMARGALTAWCLGRDCGKVCGSLRERGAAKAVGMERRFGVFVFRSPGPSAGQHDGESSHRSRNRRPRGSKETHHGARVPAHVRDTFIKGPRVFAPYSTAFGS